MTIISGTAVSLPLGPCLNPGSLGLKVGNFLCYEAVVLNYAVSPVKGFGIWGPFFFFFTINSPSVPMLHFEKPNLSGSRVIPTTSLSTHSLAVPQAFLFVTDSSRQGWLTASMPKLGMRKGGGVHVKTVYYMCCDGGRRGE